MANVKELNVNSTTYDIIGKGVVDQNNASTPLKEWSGTSAQYQALVSGGTIDSNTIYNVKDEPNTFQSLLETIYPVGSIYIGTMNICPMSALFGTWELVSVGRVLQGSDSGHVAGSTIEAGLPNITGTLVAWNDVGIFSRSQVGVFANDTSGNTSRWPSSSTSSDCTRKVSFDASNSNSIYGNSTTVQPPAFVVNIWERSQ